VSARHLTQLERSQNAPSTRLTSATAPPSVLADPEMTLFRWATLLLAATAMIIPIVLGATSFAGGVRSVAVACGNRATFWAVMYSLATLLSVVFIITGMSFVWFESVEFADGEFTGETSHCHCAVSLAFNAAYRACANHGWVIGPTRSFTTGAMVCYATGCLTMITAPSRTAQLESDSFLWLGLRPFTRAMVLSCIAMSESVWPVIVVTAAGLPPSGGRTIGSISVVVAVAIFTVQSLVEASLRQNRLAIAMSRQPAPWYRSWVTSHNVLLVASNLARLYLVLTQENARETTSLGTRTISYCILLVAIMTPVMAMTLTESARIQTMRDAASRLESTSEYLRSFVGHVSHETRVPLQAAVLAIEEISEDTRFVGHTLKGVDGTLQTWADNLNRLVPKTSSLPEPSCTLDPEKWAKPVRRVHSDVQEAMGRQLPLLESLGILNVSLRAAEEVLSQALQLHHAEQLGHEALRGAWAPLHSIEAKLRSVFGSSTVPPPVFSMDRNSKRVCAFVDSLAIHRVLSNFVSNAIKFHPRAEGESEPSVYGAKVRPRKVSFSQELETKTRRESSSVPIVVRFFLGSLRVVRGEALHASELLWPGGTQASRGGMEAFIEPMTAQSSTMSENPSHVGSSPSQRILRRDVSGAIQLADATPAAPASFLRRHSLILHEDSDATSLGMEPEDAPVAAPGVQITGEVLKKLLVIEVEDRGPGIPAVDRKNLFMPFVQISAGESRKGVGTGVGLAMCRSLARAMGGCVGYREPEDAKTGSVFFLALPVACSSMCAVHCTPTEDVSASDHSQQLATDSDRDLSRPVAGPDKVESGFHPSTSFKQPRGSRLSEISMPSGVRVSHNDEDERMVGGGWRHAFHGGSVRHSVSRAGSDGQDASPVTAVIEQAVPAFVAERSSENDSKSIVADGSNPDVTSAALESRQLTAPAPPVDRTEIDPEESTEVDPSPAAPKRLRAGRRDSAAREARRQARAQKRQAKTETAPSMLPDTTVLLVEDVDSTRIMMARSLSRLGAKVLEAVDGAHALTVLREFATAYRSSGKPVNPACPSGIALVLLDKDMPVTGFQFLESLAPLKDSADEVERAMARIRVVGCTAHGVPSTIQGFLDRGAVDVMLKPAGSADFYKQLLEASKLAKTLPPKVLGSSLPAS
jgi:signal transduction histidine kinase/DNA-binding NarL/FixJ family response regulator